MTAPPIPAWDGLPEETNENVSELLGEKVKSKEEDEDKKNKIKREEIFKKFFDLPDDILQDDFSCALQKGPAMFVQGRLYITDRHICFGSIFSPKTKVIPYSDIKSISKKTTVIVFSNALEIERISGPRLFFTSFIYRDDAHDLLNKMWSEYDDNRTIKVEIQDLDNLATTPPESNDPLSSPPDYQESEKSESDEDIPFSSVPPKLDIVPSNDQTLKNDLAHKYDQGNEVEQMKTEDPKNRLESTTSKRAAFAEDKHDKLKVIIVNKRNEKKTDDNLDPNETKAKVEENDIEKTKRPRSQSATQRDKGKIVINDNLVPQNAEKVDSDVDHNRTGSPPKIHKERKQEKPSEPSIPMPPVNESTHPNWNESVKRILLGEREMQASSLSKFWQIVWVDKKITQTWASKLEFTELEIKEWAEDNPPGCWIRNANWVSPVKLGIGPKSAQIEQSQRAKMKSNCLEIDRSTVTKGVPLAGNFTLEERWNVTMVSKDTLKVVVEFGVAWKSSLPWGSGAFKGIIDKGTVEANKSYIQIFFDLVEEALAADLANTKNAVVSSPKRISKRKPLSKIKDTKPSKGKEPPPLPPLTKEMKQHLPPPDEPNFIDLPVQAPNTNFIKLEVKEEPSILAQDPLNKRDFFADNKLMLGILLVLITILFTHTILLSYQLSSLEQVVITKSSGDSVITKVAFLEYYVDMLSKNLTDDKNCMKDHFEIWKKSQAIHQKLEEWKTHIEKMKELLKSNEMDLDLIAKQQNLMEAMNKQNTVNESSIWFWVLMGLLVVGGGFFILRKQQVI